MPLKTLFVATLAGAAFALAGCDRKPTDPPQPKALAAETTLNAPVPPAPVVDPSLPQASAALASPSTAASPTGSFNTEPMSRPTESAAMPLGGQNNDHSAPKATDPGASAPLASTPR